MNKVVATGKSVEEAVQSALRQLSASEDNVKIKVLEQPSKKFFGLMGSKEAIVEVELINKESSVDVAKSFLEDVFNAMEVEVAIEQFNREDHILLNLVGKNLGILIGRRGQTLDSLQYLVNIVANKQTSGNKTRFILDAEDYRYRRKLTLEDLAEKLAEKAVKTGRDVVLEPMTPLERKIIHSQLQNHPLVETYSLGEDPNRKVVITIK